MKEGSHEREGQQKAPEPEAPKLGWWKHVAMDAVPVAAGLVGLVAGPIGFGIGCAMAGAAMPYIKEKLGLKLKAGGPEPEKKKFNWRNVLVSGAIAGGALLALSFASPVAVGAGAFATWAVTSYRSGGVVKTFADTYLGPVKKRIQSLWEKIRGRSAAPERGRAQEHGQARGQARGHERGTYDVETTGRVAPESSPRPHETPKWQSPDAGHGPGT